MNDMQALAASIIGFIFALRACSIADISMEHITTTATTFSLVKITTKTRQAMLPETYTLPLTGATPMRAVARFVQETKKLRKQSALLSHWPARLPGQRVDNALSRVRQLLGLPRACGQQSHSLRRGAACSMVAIGVPLQRILSWGGWANEASVKPYYEGRVWSTANKHQDACFGWMIRLSSNSLVGKAADDITFESAFSRENRILRHKIGSERQAKSQKYAFAHANKFLAPQPKAKRPSIRDM